MTEPDPSSGKGRRGNLAAIVIVAVLVIGVAWLAHALYKNLQLQKCEMEGRRDCTDLPQPEP